MIRRRFLQFLGLSPAIIPVYSGVMEEDGATIKRSPMGWNEATIFMYGRAAMVSDFVASQHREEFIRRLDVELAKVKVDFIRYYDRAREGKADVAGPGKTIDDVL